MRQMALTGATLDRLDFVPTVIIGFFRSDAQEAFVQECAVLQDRYPGVDILGASSALNIANRRPYAERNREFPTVYLCMDAPQESYRIEIHGRDAAGEIHLPDAPLPRPYSAILLSSFSSTAFEQMLVELPAYLGTEHIVGGIAGRIKEGGQPVIYCNGALYPDHFMLWLLEEDRYQWEEMTFHLFRPVGLPLEITRAEGKHLYEINHRPALDVIESLTGTLDDDAIAAFGYPLFLGREAESDWIHAPIASMISINREERSILLYRDIAHGDYLKVGIMLSKDGQVNRLRCLYTSLSPQHVFLFFFCIGIAENLGMMEYLYLEDIQQHLGNTFVGLHTFGEVGRPALSHHTDTPLLHNQTLTIVGFAYKGSR